MEETKEESKSRCEKCEKYVSCCGWRGAKGVDSGSLVWFLGAVGGSIYYIQQAETFGAGVVGVLKALVWPAMLVYELLEFLGM